MDTIDLYLDLASVQPLDERHRKEIENRLCWAKETLAETFLDAPADELTLAAASARLEDEMLRFEGEMCSAYGDSCSLLAAAVLRAVDSTFWGLEDVLPEIVQQAKAAAGSPEARA